jgi:DNA-binding LytR/AlgR family response regulator
MHILIVEDEQAAARRLEKMVLELMPEATIAGQPDSVEQTVIWLKENPAPNLIFMDIQLADGASFEIFQHIEIKCPVIFITAYDAYALQAFKVNAVDYLLKPVKQVELQAALEKYRRLYVQSAPRDYSPLFQTMHRLEAPIYLKRMLIRFGNSIKLVEISDVAYFYTRDKISFLVQKTTGKRIPVDYPLDKLEGLLDPATFFRINRQIILSVPAIREMHAHSKSRVKVELDPVCDVEAVVSTEKTAEFKKWLVGDSEL